MISIDRVENVGVIRLERPPVNAINHDLIKQLSDSLDNFKGDESVKGVVLSGQPGCFSAGLDIVDLYSRDQSYMTEFWGDFSSLLINLFSFSKPVYSCINGHCPAGGTVMVIMTDYRIMSDGQFVIGLNEIDVGLTVPYGIGNVFQYVVGRRNAEDLLLKARLINPQDALSVGLIDEICEMDTIMDKTLERIQESVKLLSLQQSKTRLILREETLKTMKEKFNDDTQLILDSWFSDEGQQRLETLFNKLSKGGK